MKVTMTKQLATLALAALAAAGCDDDDVLNLQPRTFTVTVTNVSQPGTLPTDRAMGTVPLSPGAWAVFTGTNPMFTVGQPADSGTELIAEDGFPSPELSPPNTPGTETALLQGVANVSGIGTFSSPGGTPDVSALFAGESATFTFQATPGQRLQLETMFVQSNDWFYAFGDGGLDLFEGDDPVSGDVTSQLVVYDAGTEEDTAPGTGPDQKPVQSATATDVGPADDTNRIRPASETGFTVPPNTAVIRVTISSS